MLSNNNQLTLGGGSRQRARGTVRVSEPAYGFFITGSSIEAMNGVYVRRNLPRVKKDEPPSPIALYYEHEEGLWHMALNELSSDAQSVDVDDEDDEDNYMMSWRPRKKKPTHEWLFLDEFGVKRFSHDGDTIIPGAGIRWKHYHFQNQETSRKQRTHSQGEELDSWLSPYEFENVESSTSTAVAEIKPDDNDELPWQVIAILDVDMVQQLLWSSEHRKQKVRDAKAGKNATAPPRACIESASAPGRWLFKVVNSNGVGLYVAPDDSDAEVGRRDKGEYVRVIRFGEGGDWVCLDACEDLAMDVRRGKRNDRFWNADNSRRQLWIKVHESVGNEPTLVHLEEIASEEMPVLDIKEVGEEFTTGSKSETASEDAGDFFDKPFVPRMEDSNENSEVLAVTNNSADLPDVQEVQQRVAAADPVITQSLVWPTGAAVEVSGLRTRSGMQYNGVSGVVVTGLCSGRQGVRLEAPFSGKILNVRPDTLVYCETGELEGGVSAGNTERACRLLGIPLSHIGMSNEQVGTDLRGWGFGGCTPSEIVGCALRATLRDLGSGNMSGCSAARNAADHLLTELQNRGISDLVVNTGEFFCRSPEMMLRFGVLGSRTAAAVVSALNPLSNEDRENGIQLISELLLEEVDRARAADDAVLFSAGEDSEGSDELLLRLVLVQALLEGRRDADAVSEARKLQSISDKKNRKNSAVYFVLGRSLLRVGNRADAITAIDQAETMPISDGVAAWLCPLFEWGRSEANRFLLAHRAAERYRIAAVDLYSQGSFDDAATLMGKSLALLQSGCSDDKRGRATALADRAGCLRRARKLDDAVVDLEGALALFPRYTRALFRRAACLLEAGKATEAVDGFKALYRVDRNWPNLSEWLVRAFSLQKRKLRGYQGGEDAQYEDPVDSNGTSPANSSSDAATLAREVDHYAVLGVTTDATEKQLKTAYRMRSLQYHPDRNRQVGNTAAFQRIAEAYQILSDPDKRRAYDEGGDIKVKRGRKDEDDDSEEEEEEHKTSMREEVEREFYPERYHFWPFGDPFIYKRKLESQKKAKEGKPAWHDDHDEF